MFNLAEIKDTIKIEPSGFRKKKSQAITDEINRKYANKVQNTIKARENEGSEAQIRKRRLSTYFSRSWREPQHIRYHFYFVLLATRVLTHTNTILDIGQLFFFYVNRSSRMLDCVLRCMIFCTQAKDSSTTETAAAT